MRIVDLGFSAQFSGEIFFVAGDYHRSFTETLRRDYYWDDEVYRLAEQARRAKRRRAERQEMLNSMLVSSCMQDDRFNLQLFEMLVIVLQVSVAQMIFGRTGASVGKGRPWEEAPRNRKFENHYHEKLKGRPGLQRHPGHGVDWYIDYFYYFSLRYPKGPKLKV